MSVVKTAAGDFGFNDVKSQTNPLTGGLDVTSGGYDVMAAVSNMQIPRNFFPLISNISTVDAVTLQSCTVANVSRRTKSGVLLNGVKITPTAAAIGIAHFVIEPRTIPSELVGFLVYVDAAEDADLKFYIDDNATPTASFNYDWNTFQPGWKFIVPGRPSGSPAGGKWAVGTGSPVFGTTTFNRVRIRCNASTVVTKVEFYGAFELPVNQYSRPVSRVTFGADDGYSSMYTLGAGIFEEYGATVSLAPNAPLVGSSGAYMTLSQLQELKARGHEFISQNTSTTNGFGDWSGDGDRKAKVLAEVTLAKNYLLGNGLAAGGSENVFVYDRDYYKFSTADTDILDSLKTAGYVGARGPRLTTYHGNYPCPFGIDPFGNEIMTIGYLWDATPATDAARIALMIQQINEAAETGRDVFIYLHKVVTNASTSLDISEATLRSFLAAVAANSLTGKQRFATHAEILYDYAKLPRPA